MQTLLFIRRFTMPLFNLFLCTNHFMQVPHKKRNNEQRESRVKFVWYTTHKEEKEEKENPDNGMMR